MKIQVKVGQEVGPTWTSLFGPQSKRSARPGPAPGSLIFFSVKFVGRVTKKTWQTICRGWLFGHFWWSENRYLKDPNKSLVDGNRSDFPHKTILCMFFSNRSLEAKVNYSSFLLDQMTRIIFPRVTITTQKHHGFESSWISWTILRNQKYKLVC